MTAKFKQRLASEGGFTLIELLVVLIIIGILLAIAVPAYLGFKDRANMRAAESDIRQAVPALEGYYSDFGNYTGATKTTLLPYDATLTIDNVKISGTPPTESYCLDKDVNGQKAHWIGPTPGTMTEGSLCP